MWIYNKVVIDIKTGVTEYEEKRLHTGPVALCKGGGGGDGVDEEYNARLASIYEKSFDIGEEGWNLYKYGSTEAPHDVTEYKVNGEWMSQEDAEQLLANQGKQSYSGPQSLNEFEKSTRTTGPGDDRRHETVYRFGGETYTEDEARKMINEGVTGSGNVNLGGLETRTRTIDPGEGQVSQLDVEQAQLEANMGLIPLQTDTMKEQLKFQKEGLGLKRDMLEKARPIFDEYIQQTKEGIDPERAAGKAVTDVRSAHKAGVGKMARDLGRYGVGVNPASGRFVNSVKNIGLTQAQQEAEAATRARDAAKEKNYSRLSGAAGLGLKSIS